MTAQRNKWSADAEMSMRGYPIAVESVEHLTHMVNYVLLVLKSDVYGDCQYRQARAQEIVENATTKYRSGKDKSIYWFVVNDSMFGVMMTFVRQKGDLTLKSGKMKSAGIYAWVENIDAPDCSELGCVFFEKRNGKTVRIG